VAYFDNTLLACTNYYGGLLTKLLFFLERRNLNVVDNESLHQVLGNNSVVSFDSLINPTYASRNSLNNYCYQNMAEPSAQQPREKNLLSVAVEVNTAEATPITANTPSHGRHGTNGNQHRRCQHLAEYENITKADPVGHLSNATSEGIVLEDYEQYENQLMTYEVSPTVLRQYSRTRSSGGGRYEFCQPLKEVCPLRLHIIRNFQLLFFLL